MRIHRPQNKDSAFNSLLLLHSTDGSHSSSPTFISVCWKERTLCVCVFLCNNWLKINIFYVAHMSWSCCGVVYCLWVSDCNEHRCLANRVCCPLLLCLRTSVLRTSAASTAQTGMHTQPYWGCLNGRLVQEQPLGFCKTSMTLNVK